MDSHEHQEKDFLSTIFNDGQQNYMAYNQPPSMPPLMSQTLNVDILNNLMSIQGIESAPTSPTSPHINAPGLLEQQFKLTQLQQLQQLQNQIFQQQIALISGQTPSIIQNPGSVEQRRPMQNQYNGLLTPGPSADIHPKQPSVDFVSPIVLSNNYLESQSQLTSQIPPQEPFRPDIHMRPINPPHTHPINTNFNGPPRGSTSAPEHIAFRNKLPSPTDLDFDISPLTSPWLSAQQHLQPAGVNPYPTSNKRCASSSGDEGNSMPSRKRQSPAIRATNASIPGNGSGVNQRKSTRATRSTNSTPLIRSARSQKGNIAGEFLAGEIHGDSPSPVDLSMPPPAPPVPVSSASSSGSSDPVSERLDPSSQFNSHLMPVTPASIMKLGRLGINSGMAPPPRQTVPLKVDAKGKAAASTSASAPVIASKPKVTAAKNTRKGSLVSPSLKAILPASSGPHSISLSSPAPQNSTPVVQVRKTSHKAAEQKRRDSLKTTFDDLRVLLPPIPLPTDEKYPPDEILPGALPPRGPPKTGGEGPNKGVSKLQLLMCGNEYIRVLKARVERRDEEIEKLRSALEMRMNMGPPLFEGEEDVVLRKDLDAVEALGGGILGLGMGASTANTILPIAEDEGGGDDDPDEG
ncbi:hypothetical protein E4T56_gene20859 [Termitomyces sp. T112]|nr:hypothetical protein E4T56_gene20859 [Termitomyces sp. T112]KAH0580953.1 hypothetical protein H2248_012106 [Termitomyces sp. 'cryptogamus']